ncbi:MAG: translation elongation factor 4 [Candidatus Pacebacteria bacterium]|nr:translation elongation factor 4 [Candidatus Paceibacterota bacterium]
MQDKIRNFVIISHVDHGKSTLADRFLEITGAVKKDKMKEQFLDSMDLEREKGITIKMHPVRLVWKPNQTDTSGLKIKNLKLKIPDSGFILNLIDTPGHIDFSYEISRALACCEGAVLLVDVKQGIQAQTLFNLEQAQKQGLVIIGAINKIDLAQEEQIDEAKKELSLILNQKPEEILAVSGKTGQGAQELLEKIVITFPSPTDLTPLPDKVKEGSWAVGCAANFKALIFDSKYDPFSGVIAYVRVFSGEIRKGMKIYLMAGHCSSEVKEVGFFKPELLASESLQAGEIGYIKTGIKLPDKVKVGDTIIIPDIKNQTLNIKPLLGYKEPQPVLFLSLYPAIADDFDILKDALHKHKLNDPAFEFQLESQMALGRGFRCGFLGSLHAEITVGRLKSEFGLNLIATSPQVVFLALLKNGQTIEVSSPALWPDASYIQETQEPWVRVEIITPNRYFGSLFKLFPKFNITLETTQTLTREKSLLIAEAPLREIISGGFYEILKSSTEGYASFSFEQTGCKKADLVKVDVLIAGQKEEAFSKILPQEKSFSEMKMFLKKFKEVLPHQQFALSLQACIGGNIIARETISALRKDVTAKLYGGDVTRKIKLLEAQKKGKQKLKNRAGVHPRTKRCGVGVNIPAQVFLDILK